MEPPGRVTRWSPSMEPLDEVERDQLPPFHRMLRALYILSARSPKALMRAEEPLPIAHEEESAAALGSLR